MVNPYLSLLSCPKVLLEECAGISQAELDAHRKTHEMGGTVGGQAPSWEPPDGTKIK